MALFGKLKRAVNRTFNRQRPAGNRQQPTGNRKEINIYRRVSGEQYDSQVLHIRKSKKVTVKQTEWSQITLLQDTLHTALKMILLSRDKVADRQQVEQLLKLLDEAKAEQVQVQNQVQNLVIEDCEEVTVEQTEMQFDKMAQAITELVAHLVKTTEGNGKQPPR